MNINRELIKMLELMNKYPKINRFVWFVAISFTFLVFLALLPDLLAVLIKWKQLTA